MVAAAYLRDKGEKRTKVLVPDSAHGTNPASAAMAGFQAVTIRSTADGFVDLEDLKAKLGPDTAVFMITNPNTLGLFERQVRQIADMVHKAGGLIYLDGANMNAILGITRPGDFRADMMHFNPHKTFSGPHGGGGPGAGPIAVRKFFGAVFAAAGGGTNWTPLPRHDESRTTRPSPKGRGRSYVPAGAESAEIDWARAELFWAGGRVCASVLLHSHVWSEGVASCIGKCGAECELLVEPTEGNFPGAAWGPLLARVCGHGCEIESRARRIGDGYCEAAVGLWLSRADCLFSADRKRGDDDRADRNREQGNARRVC